MEQPLVSVVMPNYNNITYLPQAVDSILNQTYKDLELIIVDGHSSDGCIDMITEYQKKDERVKLVYDNGGGVGEASIIGCSKARGKYIARMDSDDISFSNRIEKEVTFLSQNPDYVLVSSAMDVIDENGSVLGRTFPCTDESLIKKSLKRMNVISQPMAMFRRDAYEMVGGYLPLIYIEDRMLWYKLSAVGKIKNFSCVLGQYRVLVNSLSHAINPYEKVLHALRNKMCDDREILQSDIELYNNICRYSKQFRVKAESNTKSNRKSKDILLFDFLKKLLGQETAEKFVCSLINQRYAKSLKELP